MTEPHEPLTEHDDQLRSWLGSVMSDGQEELAPDDLRALGERVRTGIVAEDARPLARHRQRPAWQRTVAGLGLVVLTLSITAAISPRGDLPYYPLARLALEVGSFLAVFALCVTVVTRGTHLPELPRPWTHGLAAAAVLVVVAVGLLPPPHAHDPHVSRGLGELVSYCGPGGVLMALPVYALVRLLDRGSSVGALAAVSAAGVAANTFLQVHCPITDSAHLLLGHATVGVYLLLGLALIGAIERRRTL